MIKKFKTRYLVLNIINQFYENIVKTKVYKKYNLLLNLKNFDIFNIFNKNFSKIIKVNSK